MKRLEKESTEMSGDSTLEVFLKALKKKHWKYELINDGNRIVFTKRKNTFFADRDSEDDFVIIYFLHNIYINMEDDSRLSLLKRAVNFTNTFCGVTTYYDNNESEDIVFVMSRKTIYFVTENPNFEIELEMVLQDCLAAQFLMKGFIKKYKCKRRRQ
jgi:hypothetical protein